MFSINLKNFLVNNVLLDMPFSLTFILLGLLLCGFKDKISKKSVILFTLIQSLIDTLTCLVTQKYGMQMFPYFISSIILIPFIFKIDIYSSTIIVILTMFLTVLYQIAIFSGIEAILKVPNIIDTLESNTLFKISTAEICYLILGLLIILMYKKNLHLFTLRRFKLLEKLNSQTKIDINENTRIILTALFPLFIFLAVNFSVFYYESYNNIHLSSSVFLFANAFAIAASSIIMLFLIKKIIKLKNYRLEWTAQQNYLGDVNELLKRLRAQKHGFLNHINIINGLLTLKDYESAKEYIQTIHETVSLKNNAISLDNPTLSAMLNAKVEAAESKNIGFFINLDDSLSSMNFKSFEICEAIGNIIDNAIEAACAEPLDKKEVNIKIYSDNKYYIFDIENTGKQIPKDIISKIFDEGFSTKDYENGDHGFGLYISRNIIEYHRGKIEVESNESITSFKIYLPKVINNEFKAS